MERSSFEVPFSPVLFYVAQAPSEGPSCGQKVLSECASIRPNKASSASALTISFLGEQEPHSCSRLFLFLSLYLPSCWMCSFPAWVVLLFQCGCGSMPVPSAPCSSVLPKIHPLEYWAAGASGRADSAPLQGCSVFFLNCLEVAELVPDQAANKGKKKGKKNQFSSSLSTGLWKREVCSILWRSGGLFFPHLISLEMF